MSLDFEALGYETLDPSPSKGSTKIRRLQTVNRLLVLGVSTNLIASACYVTPPTVRQWRFSDTSPRSYTALVALDRLDPLLNHLTDDLGLTDEAMGNFLTTERWGTDEELSMGPCFAGHHIYNKPLIEGLGTGNILKRVEERLQLRFPERQVEAQAEVIATPDTVV